MVLVVDAVRPNPNDLVGAEGRWSSLRTGAVRNRGRGSTGRTRQCEEGVRRRGTGHHRSRGGPVAQGRGHRRPQRVRARLRQRGDDRGRRAAVPRRGGAARPHGHARVRGRQPPRQGHEPLGPRGPDQALVRRHRDRVARPGDPDLRGQVRGLQPAAGRDLPALPRDRRAPSRRHHQGRAGHVRRPAGRGRPDVGPVHRGLRPAARARRRGVAVLPGLPDRRRADPRHGRRRGRQPHPRARGPEDGGPADRAGRPQLRRHRDRPGRVGRPGRLAGPEPGQGAGRARRLPRGLRAREPLPDREHALQPVVLRPAAGAAVRRADHPAVRAQGDRPALRDGAQARRGAQPRRRHPGRRRLGRRGGGHQLPDPAHHRGRRDRRRARRV